MNSYNNNNNGNKYIAINNISLYISQLLNNKEYNNALNTYSECLQIILNTILTKSNDDLNLAITNLINNETNIHSIIVYIIQMMKEKNYFKTIDFSSVDNNSLIRDISQITNAEEALSFIKLKQKWLYFNSNFKQFLNRIIELNLSNLSSNTMNRQNILYWKNIYEEIVNNYQYCGNNLYLVNSIWYQELRLLYSLYCLISLYNHEENEKDYAFTLLRNEINKLQVQIQEYANTILKNNQTIENLNNTHDDKIRQISTLQEMLEKCEEEKIKQDNLQQEIASTNTEISTIKKLNDSLILQLDQLNNSLEEEKFAKLTLKQLNDDLKQKLDQSKNSIATLKQSNEQLEKEFKQSRNSLTTLEQSNEQLEKEFKQSRNSLTTLEQSNEQSKRELDKSRNSLMTLEQSNEQLKQKLGELSKSNEQLNNTKQELEQSNNALKQQLGHLNNVLAPFEQLKHKLEELERENLVLQNRFDKLLYDKSQEAVLHNSYVAEVNSNNEAQETKCQQKINDMKIYYDNIITNLNSDLQHERANLNKYSTTYKNLFKQLEQMCKKLIQVRGGGGEETKMNDIDNLINNINSNIDSIITTYEYEKDKQNEIEKIISQIIDEINKNEIKKEKEEEEEEKILIKKLEKRVKNLLKMYKEGIIENNRQLKAKLQFQDMIRKEIKNIYDFINPKEEEKVFYDNMDIDEAPINEQLNQLYTKIIDIIDNQQEQINNRNSFIISLREIILQNYKHNSNDLNELLNLMKNEIDRIRLENLKLQETQDQQQNLLQRKDDGMINLISLYEKSLLEIQHLLYEGIGEGEGENPNYNENMTIPDIIKNITEFATIINKKNLNIRLKDIISKEKSLYNMIEIVKSKTDTKVKIEKITDTDDEDL